MISEELEPIFVVCISSWFNQVTRDRDYHKFWCKLQALSTVASVAQCPHAIIAMQNHLRRTAEYIEAMTGENPYDYEDY